jgi:hypothetical protein
VQLTWDADDDGRKRALTHRPNAEELKEDDFRVGCRVAGLGVWVIRIYVSWHPCCDAGDVLMPMPVWGSRDVCKCVERGGRG